MEWGRGILYRWGGRGSVLEGDSLMEEGGLYCRDPLCWKGILYWRGDSVLKRGTVLVGREKACTGRGVCIGERSVLVGMGGNLYWRGSVLVGREGISTGKGFCTVGQVGGLYWKRVLCWWAGRGSLLEESFVLVGREEVTFTGSGDHFPIIAQMIAFYT